MNCWTTNLSIILDSTGVMEIGLKSDTVLGCGTFLIGKMDARFH
jgi:hypothetical protein